MKRSRKERTLVRVVTLLSIILCLLIIWCIFLKNRNNESDLTSSTSSALKDTAAEKIEPPESVDFENQWEKDIVEEKQEQGCEASEDTIQEETTQRVAETTVETETTPTIEITQNEPRETITENKQEPTKPKEESQSTTVPTEDQRDNEWELPR